MKLNSDFDYLRYTVDYSQNLGQGLKGFVFRLTKYRIDATSIATPVIEGIPTSIDLVFDEDNLKTLPGLELAKLFQDSFNQCLQVLHQDYAKALTLFDKPTDAPPSSIILPNG